MTMCATSSYPFLKFLLQFRMHFVRAGGSSILCGLLCKCRTISCIGQISNGWGRAGQATFSSFCLLLLLLSRFSLSNNLILAGRQDDIWFPQSQHVLPQVIIFLSPNSTSQKAEMLSFCKVWWHVNYYITENQLHRLKNKSQNCLL